MEKLNEELTEYLCNSVHGINDKEIKKLQHCTILIQEIRDSVLSDNIIKYMAPYLNLNRVQKIESQIA
jgi:hypothetical protein